MNDVPLTLPARDTNELIDRIQNAVADVLAKADHLLPPHAYRNPAPESWSIAEILAHVVEMLPYWADQAREVALRERDGLPFGRTHDDPHRIAAVRDHAHDDVHELANGVQAALNNAVAILQGIPESDWQRTALHARRGEMTVYQIVEQFMAEHAEEHAQQFADVLEMCGARA